MPRMRAAIGEAERQKAQRRSRRLYGALAEAAGYEGGYPVALRVKSMCELERNGWAIRSRTGEISPGGIRREVWLLTDAGREALQKYLAE